MNDNDKRNLCTGCGLMPQKPVSPKPPVCGCKKKKCCKKDCCENDFVFRKVVIPAALGDDETGKAKPENGAYTNSYVEYEANGAQYMYDSYGVYTKIEGGGNEGTLDFNELENRPKYAGEEMTSNTDIPDVAAAVAGEATLRENADSGLQSQIDALSAASDVTDIVGTYAELEAYDTSKLKDNDIIKVLQDETHDDETTYYRWSTSTEEFSLIGEEGPYYTKAAADQKFQDKLTAGDGVTIDSNNVISADGETIFYANLSETGTTRHIYKDIDFTSAASAQDIIDANDKGQVILRGTSLVNPTAYSDSYLQNAFIMPHNNDYEFVFLDRDLRYEYTASATTDTAFYYDTSEIQPKLTAGTNVQITGTTISATDTTYNDFTGTDGVDAGTAGLVPAPAVSDAGKYLKADGTWDSVSGGIPTTATFWGQSYDSINNKVSGNIEFGGSGVNRRALALDPYSNGLNIYGGSFNVNRGTSRLFGVSTAQVTVENKPIRSVADPTNAQDAATKNYTDNLVISYAALNGTAAPTTATEAKYVGQLYYDTTNDDMYYCSAITAQGTTPETYSYTWNTIGGGPTVVQTIGTSTTDVMSQDASTKLVYADADGSGNRGICVPLVSTGSNNRVNVGARSIMMGSRTNNAALGNNSVSIGYSAGPTSSSIASTVQIGEQARANYNHSVAIGDKSIANRTYEFSVGKSGTTRFVANVTDPELAQDAATKNYTDNLVISYASLNGAGAPTTATEAKYVGQLYYDTTNDDMYYCSAITAQGTTPETYEYTWEAIGGGGGLDPTTTFWGQTASGGAVQGTLTVDGASSSYQLEIGGAYQSTSDNRITRTSSGFEIFSSATFRVTRRSNERFRIDQTSTRIGNAPLIMTTSSDTSVIGGQIKQMADPTDLQDAATKNYVDSIYPVGAVFTSTSATAPTIAGGTWTEIGTQTIGSSTVHYYERTA